MKNHIYIYIKKKIEMWWEIDGSLKGDWDVRKRMICT